MSNKNRLFTNGGLVGSFALAIAFIAATDVYTHHTDTKNKVSSFFSEERSKLRAQWREEREQERKNIIKNQLLFQENSEQIKHLFLTAENQRIPVDIDTRAKQRRNSESPPPSYKFKMDGNIIVRASFHGVANETCNEWRVTIGNSPDLAQRMVGRIALLHNPDVQGEQAIFTKSNHGAVRGNLFTNEELAEKCPKLSADL